MCTSSSASCSGSDCFFKPADGAEDPCVSAGPDGKEVFSQLLPVSNATRELQATMLETNLTESADSAASAELAFIASVPPVG